jgi:hypothetical protein
LNQISAINEDKKGNLWIAVRTLAYPLIRISVQSLLDLVNTQKKNEWPISVGRNMYEYFPSNIDM